MDNSHFFIVVPPGFEALAAMELHEKFPGLPELKLEKGGFECEAPLSLGLAMNQYLKIPSAILLRVARFTCKDFPKLFNKTKNIQWSDYLLGEKYELSVASQKSRLLNEKRIEASVRDGIARRFQMQPPKKPKNEYAMEVQVRFFDDEGTFSINLSGEPLFKRGYKSMGGTAPIRENIAAGLYYALWKSGGGFDTLVDPFCGSGTLLLEAQLFAKKVKSRTFAYQNKPEWTAAEVAIEIAGPQYFYGFDKEAKVLQNFNSTLGELKSKHHSFGQSQVICRDLFSLDAWPVWAGGTRAVICNPPYGERLKLPLPPQDYYQNLLRRLVTIDAKSIGVVVPQRFLKWMTTSVQGYQLKEKISFENGGIPVVFCIYHR